MKVGPVPASIRAVFARWTASRKATVLKFVPNDGALDLRLNDQLVGQMWVDDDGHLHIAPVKLVQISKRELADLVAQALAGFAK